MRKVLMVIPFMTVFANIAIFLDIPILREVIVFIFLSFIPGFAILRLFKLKEASFLNTILFSVALSIAFVMFVGLLVNELYLFLGFSQSWYTIPLTVAISAFTLTVFFIEYRRDLSEALKLKTSFEGKLKNVFTLSIILFLLPAMSAIGVLYSNVSVIILSYAIVVALCLLSVVSRRLLPENLFPFLIFSISITLICQVVLTSKYITGWDANIEYYVFRLTQQNGHWGFLYGDINLLNSMLSITLLPAVYSSLMHAQGEVVFKILYPFIFSLVPLTLYQICAKQFGKMIGLLSVLFFVFTTTAFHGTEILSVNRQIVGELFLLLSVFLLISYTIPVTKRRLLLIILGAALAVSHYSLAYIYLAIIVLLFIISKAKPRFGKTLNAVTVLLLFVLTLSWYAWISNAPIKALTDTIKWVFEELGTGSVPSSGTASDLFFIPQVFNMASWINLLLSGIANLFLIIGVLLIIFRIKGNEIFPQFKAMLTMAAVVLVVSLVLPSVARRLNFTRFYAIALLFLSPCFVLGCQALLETIGKVWTKIRRPLKRQIASKSKNIDVVLLLMGVILSAYFLSQVGFVNHVAGGVPHYNIDFSRMITSNESQVKISLYQVYIPEQDVFSASWLFNHKVVTADVFADYLSRPHVLTSYGLIPDLVFPITNTTIPPQGSIVYLGSLNIVNGVITTTIGSFNTSEISFILDHNNLVYSNGNSEIWYVAFAPDSS
jgi:uncharacterized membrane protein